ncbi:cell division protein ZapA [Actinomycetes bacterium NPDC127524]|uniref:cell division protein ZapA n=1 Tax=Bacillaceae TaxID=186817 RepID=UPI0008EBAAD6|nr:cell division protein ZapA [Bacillus sp. OV322]SFC56523.1 cell division protein ZapA [Bacillus sp. OV322]
MPDDRKNRTTVDIYGQQYTIMGAESTGHIRLVASMVDDSMREISMKNPSLDTSKLAVLTAVNAIHDYLKLKDQIDQLKLELQKEKD